MSESFPRRLARFIRQPHVPHSIAMRWKPISRRLRYGFGNINTTRFWDDTWRQELEQGRERAHNYVRLHAAMREAINPDDLLLDAGCGSGVFIKSLDGALTTRPCACDFSAVAVEHVAPWCSEARVVELPHLPVDWLGRFDVVVCGEVLEHVADAPAVAESLVRALRPGGRLIASVPHRPSGKDDHPEHVRGFSAASFRELIAAVGVAGDPRVIREDTNHEFILLIGRRGVEAPTTGS